jgi:hypothetical protein
VIGGCGLGHGGIGKYDGQKWRIEELFRNRNKKFSAIVILSIKFLRKAFNIFTSLFKIAGTERGGPC